MRRGRTERGSTAAAGIPPPQELTEDTVIVLMDGYTPLAGELEAAYFGADRVGFEAEGDRLLFVAYRVRVGP